MRAFRLRALCILAWASAVAFPAVGAEGTWAPMSTVGAPILCCGQTAVWTGSHMIVWGVQPGFTSVTGAIYDSTTDTWAPMTSIGAPTSVASPYNAAWTGSEAIVFGGMGFPGSRGIYDPATDTWAAMSPLPIEIQGPVVSLWTGSKLIVWDTASGFGSLYDPGADSWTPMSHIGAPLLVHQFGEPVPVWTGSKMLVWNLGVGASFDLASNTWAPISQVGAPGWRANQTTVWTGSKMIVWGGSGSTPQFLPLASGGVYDPATDEWSSTSLVGAPSARTAHAAVWTGSKMIVWGGRANVFGVGNTEMSSGGIYDPATDTWIPTSDVGAPQPRAAHNAVWTGSQMLIWAGSISADTLNTGGILTSTVNFANAATSVSKNGKQAVVQVNCSGLLSSDSATVAFTTLDGTANAPRDYASTSGTLTFGPTSLSQTFVVPIAKDTFAGGDQALILRLSDPQGTTLGLQDTAVLTITDSSKGGKVQFSSAAYSVAEGSGEAKLTVKRTGSLASSATVHYATSAGTATGGGTDYADTSGDLTFPVSGAGATTQIISIPITQDALPEGAETLTVSLSTPTGEVVLGTPVTASVTILDDESTLEFNATTYSVKESQANALITVRRSGPLAGTVKVNYATGGMGDTATAGADYKAVSGTLTFTAGVLTRAFMVPILKDTLVEGPETLGLALSSPQGINLGATSAATLTILDDDLTPTIQFSSGTYTVNEATPRATVTVKRSGNLADVVTVDYAATGGTALNAPDPNADYDLPNGTLTFGKGVTVRTLSVPIVNDTIDEGTETVILQLANKQNLDDAGHVAFGPLSTAVLNITDNEPTVQFSAAAYSTTEAATSVLITVKRTGTLTAPATVTYDATGGTAVRDTGAGGDYRLVSGALSFAAGQSVKKFTIALEPDTVAGGTKTIELSLSAPSGAALGTPSQTVVAIKDNDTAGKAQFSAAQYSVAETAGVATISVTRTGGTSSEATVGYAVGSGASANPAGVGDFDAASGVLTFGANETSRTFAVTVHDNGTPDAGAVSVDLTLDTPGNGLALGTPTAATLWIVRE